MKYGESLFNRTRDTRPQSQPVSPPPTAANSASASPAIVPTPARPPAAAALPETPRDDAAGSKLIVGPNIKLCLLYTSPSPRDRQKSRMPSSA